MSVFEIIMLVSFGAAWPFSIYKSYTSRKTGGKSPVFMVIVVIGYTSGILHKIFYNYDFVVYLYLLNLFLVCVDLALYFRNLYIEKEQGLL